VKVCLNGGDKGRKRKVCKSVELFEKKRGIVREY